MNRQAVLRLALIVGVLGLAGCATPAREGELIADPFEQTNREIHDFNVGVDFVLLRPVTIVYDEVTPDLFKFLIGNAVDHLRLPLIAINELLQGRGLDALATVARFGVNTVAGAGGLLDPASEIGLLYNHTDFGETLHVLGAPEGPFIMLPLLGPATGRDAVGRVVDFVLDPWFFVAPGGGSGQTALQASRIVSPTVVERYRAFDIVDEVFYEAEDGYLMIRSLFVQNRRRSLMRDEIDPDSLPDIFAD